jgi:hypothetical protein
MSAETLRRRIRCWVAFFIFALVVSGLTAFPLQTELELLVSATGADAAGHAEGGLHWWLLTVRNGLSATYGKYPWLAYGTDWLAFAHIVIGVFFIGPYRDPVRNVWVIQAGLIACLGVVILAFTAGPVRGIPFYWRVIDSAFGILGALPLWHVLRMIRRLEELSGKDRFAREC